MAGRLGVLWEGSFAAQHSLANVNRALVALLASVDEVDLGLIAHESDDAAAMSARLGALAALLEHRPADVGCHVRHRWPPDLSRPASRCFVLMQPWEYGWLPASWVEAVRADVDEVWTNSRFERDVYVRSGIPGERVAVVPLGVDAAVFHPDAPCVDLATDRSFRFLFVGGALERKGFDLLLRAYAAEFTADDDVCLVVKDLAFYDVDGDAWLAPLRRRPGAPEVLYVRDDVEHRQVAGLYTACDCAVHPYRAEGFCLPVLEAMACGLPVIVTGAGPALDFCPPDLAYLVPAAEAEVPSLRWPRSLPTVRPATWYEPDVVGVRRWMRHVVEQRDDARRRGLLGSAYVRNAHTWRETVAAVVARLERWC